MSMAETLADINTRWIEECSCELKYTATNPVPGEGSARAQIMFIGEAPGKDEDAQGRPFVGAAGKLLTQMLNDNGYERDDVYITNVVKYRPPNNRDPEPEEVESCWPWLYEQINCIQPKLIVLLGRHALNRFFPEERISHVHGKVLKRKFVNLETPFFFALYHPAAALYKGDMREVLAEDFAKLPKVVKAIEEGTLTADKEKDDHPVDASDTKEQERITPPEKGPDQSSLF